MWDQGKSSRYPMVPNNQGLGKCMRKKWLELHIDSVFYPFYYIYWGVCVQDIQVQLHVNSIFHL